MTAKVNPKNLVPSINKAIDIIELLHKKGDMTLKEITSYLDLPVSTGYNIVTTLDSRGVIKKNPKTSKYGLGLTLMKWGLHAYNQVDIRKIAIPYLRNLVKEFNETANLVIFNKQFYENMVVEKVESSHHIRSSPQIGLGYASFATAAGRCFLANLSNEEIDLFFNEVKNDRLSTDISKSKLRQELEETKLKGYSVTINELGTGAASVASAIKNYQGDIIAAISLTGPVDRMVKQIPSMIKSVKNASEKISQKI